MTGNIEGLGRIEAVTPSDADELSHISQALYVGAAGDVTVDGYLIGTNVTFEAVPAGTTLWIRATRVYATGTTATGIIALA